jgi:hypothetical protein
VVLVDFLRVNANIFAWSPLDISGIAREVAEHVTPRFLINVISANDRISRVKPTDNGQT